MAIESKNKTPMGVELVRRGIVTQTDVEKAMDYQREHPNKKIGDIIHILDLCDQNTLIDAIAEIVEEKGIILRYSDINITITDYISLDVAKQNKAVPFDIQNGKVKVCFADTSNKRAMETVRLLLLNKGLVMEKYITFESNIEAILESFEGQATDNITISRDVTTLVDNIIKTGMEKRASDIHIEPLEKEVRVRYRIDGELLTVAEIGKDKQSQIIGRLKAISNMHQEKQESQDRKNYNV